MTVNAPDPTTFQPPIQLGFLPLTKGEIDGVLVGSMDRIMIAYQREIISAKNAPIAVQMGTASEQIAGAVEQINAFNIAFHGTRDNPKFREEDQVYGYKQAKARLAKYRKADGQVKKWVELPTGFNDENGDPITYLAISKPEIEALPATVEVQVFNIETMETSTETVPNPEIIKDDEERAEAEAVVASMPQEMIDFVSGPED